VKWNKAAWYNLPSNTCEKLQEMAHRIPACSSNLGLVLHVGIVHACTWFTANLQQQAALRDLLDIAIHGACRCCIRVHIEYRSNMEPLIQYGKLHIKHCEIQLFSRT